VHTYGFWANVFGIPAARVAGTPVVLGAIRDNGDHITPAQRRVQRAVCRLADGIVVNAEAIRRRLTQEGYDPRRISVVPNGIDLTPFGRPGPGGRLRRELGLPEDAPIVAVFARVAPVKGLEYFLQAASGVYERFPSARFLVVGETRALAYGVPVPSSYTHGLQAMAMALGLGDRVIFTGVREDVAELMEEVSVVVSPSLDEGLSNSVLEAMAARAPVVATRVGGTPEAVEDGVTGLLVPARDAAALARAIGTLLEDRELARRLGEAARERVTRRFSIEEMVRRTARLYSTLVEERVH
jgi:glycosyltransferase involved in cell wall biosynthesis